MDVRDNRNFGFIMAAAFALLAYKFGGALLILAATFALLAWRQPMTLESPRKIWLILGRTLQKITEPILLGVIFFFVLTPMGIIRRKLGKSKFRKKPAMNAETYWHPKTEVTTAESLKRQF